MLELPLNIYKDKVSKIRELLSKDFNDAKLKSLINRADILRENIRDLKINYKDFYETEINDLLYEAENFIDKKKRDLKEEIKKEGLKQAMRKYSRWRINELAENDENIRNDLERVLKTKAKRVIAGSIKTGERIIFRNANQASKELGVSAGVISKCCRNILGSKTGISKINGNTYTFNMREK